MVYSEEPATVFVAECPNKPKQLFVHPNLVGPGPPVVDRIWLRVYYNKNPIYPILCIFYLLKGDY